MPLPPEPLFREQALLALTRPPPGEPLIATPPGWRAWTTLLATFALLAVVTLVVLEMPRQAMATGLLVPEQGLHWVHTPVAGVVEAVRVAQGDLVRRGQTLLRITHDVDASGGAIGELRRSFDAQLQLLDERLRIARESRALLQQEQAGQRLDLESRLAALQAEVALEQSRTRLAGTTRDTYRSLARQGAVSRAESDRVQAQWLESRQRLGKLRAELGLHQSLRATLPVQQARARKEIDGQLATIGQERQAAEQRRLELDLARASDLDAPVSGRVVALRPNAGQFVAAQSPQIALLPEGASLRAELQVPSTALGLVRPGSTLRLQFESLPHQKFGSVDAIVSMVSPVLQPAGSGSALHPPTFGVHAQLTRSTIGHGNRSVVLLPDMRLRAIIVLERRRAWEWLLEPLLEALRR